MSAPRPFIDGPWKLAMGLRALDPADWLERDADALAQIPRRRDLLRERPDDLVATTRRSLPAQDETLRVVRDHLARHDPAAPGEEQGPAVASAIGRPAVEVPLVKAAALVAEDLCLMEEGDDGYRLTAGVVCFPLHWSPREKLGRTLGSIHAPVPGLADRIGMAIDRFFDAITPDRPVWRANWSLVDTAEPFLPPAHRGDARRFDPARPTDTLWLRTERQTLRRLPRTGAVLFTIRTRIEPLGEVLDEPGAAEALAARIREMPETVARYKGILPIREALLDYIAPPPRSSGGSRPSGLAATG